MDWLCRYLFLFRLICSVLSASCSIVSSCKFDRSLLETAIDCVGLSFPFLTVLFSAGFPGSISLFVWVDPAGLTSISRRTGVSMPRFLWIGHLSMSFLLFTINFSFISFCFSFFSPGLSPAYDHCDRFEAVDCVVSVVLEYARRQLSHENASVSDQRLLQPLFFVARPTCPALGFCLAAALGVKASWFERETSKPHKFLFNK